MKMDYKCECGKDILLDLDYETEWCPHCELELDVARVVMLQERKEEKARIALKKKLNSLISDAIALALIHNDNDFTSEQVQELMDYQDYLESDEV